MDEVSQRSARVGILYEPISWEEDDLATLKDSEEKLLWSSYMFSKVLIDEEDAFTYFVAGLHNYIEVLAEYNTHSRELSQMLYTLFEVSQRKHAEFIKLVSLNSDIIEHLAYDLRRWREQMAQQAYSYKLIHKLHEPTMSAILQIIELIDPTTSGHDSFEDSIELF